MRLSAREIVFRLRGPNLRRGGALARRGRPSGRLQSRTHLATGLAVQSTVPLGPSR